MTAKTAAGRGWGAGYPHCQHSKLTTIHAGGIRLSVRREVAPIFKGFCDELVQRSYPLGAVADDWGFACRPIRGTKRTPSNHSWGLAIDLNSTANPMSSDLVTDFPAWAVELGENKYGLHWGGRYKTRPDAMHWEWLGTPDQARWLIAALAALPPNHQPPEPPPRPPEENNMPTVTVADVQLDPKNPTRGYMLDAAGGVHPLGTAKPLGPDPAGDKRFQQWKKLGIGPARLLRIVDWEKPAGYVVDALGAMHPFGGAPHLQNVPYWQRAFVPPAPVV